MAIADVQGILQALVAGQSTRQSGIDTELRRQQLQQQAAQNLAQNELMQQQHKLETDRLNFQNQSEIARRQAENIAMRINLGQNPDAAAAAGTPIGTPDASGYQRYEVTGTPADPTGQDKTPLEFNAPTREQYLKDLSTKSIASSEGARQNEEIRYAHSQSESDADRTFREEMQRRLIEAENERARLQRNSEAFRWNLQYGQSNGPQVVSDYGNQILNGTKSEKDLSALKQMNPRMVSDVLNYVSANKGTVQREDDIAALKQLRNLKDIIPDLRSINTELGSTGIIGTNPTLTNAKIQASAQTLQGIAKGLSDTSFRNGAIIQKIQDAYTPSLYPLHKGGNTFKVDELINNLASSVEAATQGMSESQKAATLKAYGLDKLPSKYKNQPENGKGRINSDGTLSFSTDGGKTWFKAEGY